MQQISALILSDKSAGSSALQRELVKHPDVNHIRSTPHNEHETLFWSKAVAALGRPQPAMLGSSVIPMERTAAIESLQSLLDDNLPGTHPPPTDKQQILQGWQELTEAYEPVFLEKSPHHLHNRAVIELIIEAREELDVDFRFVGLVRNPVDTMYSMWRRWRLVPERAEAGWCLAYGNLAWLRDVQPDATHIVKYEDLVTRFDAFEGVCRSIELDPVGTMGRGFNSESVGVWKSDSDFGYQPSAEVREMAAAFGYSQDDIATQQTWRWPVRRELGQAHRRLRSWAGSARRRWQK